MHFFGSTKDKQALGAEPSERGCFGHAATWAQELCACDKWGSSGEGQEEPSIHIPPACPWASCALPAPALPAAAHRTAPCLSFPGCLMGLQQTEESCSAEAELEISD